MEPTSPRAREYDAKQSQKATAYVYWGAAFLVLILGFRTIMETLGIGEEWRLPITFLAMVSLVAEFSLLIYYGNTIRKAPTKSNETLILPIETVEKFDEVIAGLQRSLESFEAAVHTIQATTDAIRTDYRDLHDIAMHAHTSAAENAEAIASSLAGASAAQVAIAASADELRARHDAHTAHAEETAASMRTALGEAGAMLQAAAGAHTSFSAASDAHTEAIASFRHALEALDAKTDAMQQAAAGAAETFLRSATSFQDATGGLARTTESLDAFARILLGVSEQSFRQKVLLDIMSTLQKAAEQAGTAREDARA